MEMASPCRCRRYQMVAKMAKNGKSGKNGKMAKIWQENWQKSLKWQKSGKNGKNGRSVFSDFNIELIRTSSTDWCGLNPKAGKFSPPSIPFCPGCGTFFSKYSATHDQVTRSAPSRNPNDHRYLTLTPEKLKNAMSRHSQLRKEINSK